MLCSLQVCQPLRSTTRISGERAANIARCDRQIFERLKALDRATLRRELAGHLQNWEIDAVLKRRDAIVKIIEQKGPAGLFDRRRTFQ